MSLPPRAVSFSNGDYRGLFRTPEMSCKLKFFKFFSQKSQNISYFSKIFDFFMKMFFFSFFCTRMSFYPIFALVPYYVCIFFLFFKKVKIEVAQPYFEVFQKLRPIAHLLRRILIGNRQNEVG